MTINEKIKFLRKQNDFTQSQVASYLGVDQSLITKFENGDRNISNIHIMKLSALFGCDLLSDDDCNTISFAFRANQLNNDDLKTIAKINQIALNLRFMEVLKND